MKKIWALLVFIFPLFAFAQTAELGLVIGDGVRVRSKPTVKSKEIGKFSGIHAVTILQEWVEWDNLGKKDLCDKHKWVKVKWEGDSTGWVYGKYVYFDNRIKIEGAPKFIFNLNNTNYHLTTFQNYTYPIADEEGITGCGYMYQVMITKEGTNNYVQIKDVISKKNETHMVLEDDDGINEQIRMVKLENEQIIVEVNIGHQDGSASAIYTIRYLNGQFNVVGYESTELKN
jgi:Bacterial SH3 domain